MIKMLRYIVILDSAPWHALPLRMQYSSNHAQGSPKYREKLGLTEQSDI